jgi:glutathione S-transferase
MSIILYAAPMSSAMPVEHALLELDVPHERVELDITKGEQRAPDFLALNPNGKVPTVVVDDTPMFEALAIMQWLGERYGVARGVWPSAQSPQRLEAMSWTTWAYVTFGAALQRLIFAGSERTPEALRHPPQVEHCKQELRELLTILDGRLASRAHLLGDSFSLADLIVASAVTYGTYCGASTEGLNHVEGWLQRFQARPQFKQIWEAAA